VAEPARGLAHDVGWLTAGLVVVLAGSAGATGVLCTTGSPQTMAAASFSGSLAFATLWFHLTSPVGRDGVWHRAVVHRPPLAAGPSGLDVGYWAQ